MATLKASTKSAMKQKISISIIVTLMVAIIDSGTLLNAEDQPLSTENKPIAQVVYVRGKKAYYKRKNMKKKWSKLSDKQEEYKEIYFYEGDLVRVEKPSIVQIKCTSNTMTSLVPSSGRAWSPASQCS